MDTICRFVDNSFPFARTGQAATSNGIGTDRDLSSGGGELGWFRHHKQDGRRGITAICAHRTAGVDVERT
jgi:hypothetical protein